MKKLITIGILVLAANIAMAQKEATATPVNTNPEVGAQVRSHSNTNNNREADGGGTKLGKGVLGTGESGTKKKFEVGKLFKKK